MPRALILKPLNIWVYAWARVDADFNQRMSGKGKGIQVYSLGKGLDVSRIKIFADFWVRMISGISLTKKKKSQTTCEIRKLSFRSRATGSLLISQLEDFMLHMVRIIATAPETYWKV